MPFFVIPDSWATYGIGKAGRALRRAAKGRGSGKISLGARGRGFSYKFSHLNLYQDELRKYLNTQSGDLWWYLNKRGKAAVAGAQAMVGVRTGALKRSIHMKHLGNVTGQYIWIGSKLPYAYAHHEGTRPHIIASKSGKELVFRGRGSKVLVHTPVVKHPGTRPNPYLRAQLHHFFK
jgi:hypothetical protein